MPAMTMAVANDGDAGIVQGLLNGICVSSSRGGIEHWRLSKKHAAFQTKGIMESWRPPTPAAKV